MTLSPAHVSIIIPAKNEMEGLARLLPAIKQNHPHYEIIVVDDASTDRTPDIAEENQVKLIRHLHAKGNGAAIKNGARAATGDILIFIDADGQHNPSDISTLINKLDQGYDMLIGARQRGSQGSMGRGLANWFYNHLASYMTNHRIEDLTSGFRAVRADKFLEFLYLLPNGFSYPTTCTMAFLRAGYSVGYTPIHAAKRVGKSHLSPWKDGIRFLLIIFKIGSLYSPLKLFAPLAITFLFLGIGWYGYTFIAMNRFTNMSALLISAAFIVFTMGLISEQITALMYKKD